MSIDPETPLRPRRYISAITSSGINYIPGLLITTFPILVFSAFIDIYPFLKYGILSFGGLAVYIVQKDIIGDMTNVNNEFDSKTAKFVAFVLVVVYYNILLYIGMILGVALEISNAPVVAIATALAYPMYDFEVAKLYAPISVAGVIVFVLAVLASLMLMLENIVGWVQGQTILAEMRKWYRSDESTQDAILGGIAIMRDIFRVNVLTKSTPR